LQDVAERHGAQTARAAADLPALALVVDGEPIVIRPAGDRIQIDHDTAGAAVFELDGAAFAELMHGTTSTFGLQMSARARAREGSMDTFVRWEPALRCLLAGLDAYVPGSIAFTDLDGSTLDIRQSFTLDDDPRRIGHFLGQAGYLHLKGVFSEKEMAAVRADLDSAMRAATRDDGASWWARTEDEGWYPARILGFNHKSPALQTLLTSDRYLAIGTFTDDTYIARDPFTTDGAEGLFKKVGVVEGISDVSWHKDCATGAHSQKCCELIVGVSLSAAGPGTGELGVAVGSHRANVAPLGIDGVDLPRIALPTDAGDVTVHCSCTLHMSRPPVSGQRQVVYTGFGLAPREDGERAYVAESRQQRSELNDYVRRSQNDHELGASLTSSEL
jgi:hypothetical protein